MDRNILYLKLIGIVVFGGLAVLGFLYHWGITDYIVRSAFENGMTTASSMLITAYLIIDLTLKKDGDDGKR